MCAKDQEYGRASLGLDGAWDKVDVEPGHVDVLDRRERNVAVGGKEADVYTTDDAPQVEFEVRSVGGDVPRWKGRYAELNV